MIAAEDGEAMVPCLRLRSTLDRLAFERETLNLFRNFLGMRDEREMSRVVDAGKPRSRNPLRQIFRLVERDEHIFRARQHERRRPHRPEALLRVVVVQQREPMSHHALIGLPTALREQSRRGDGLPEGCRSKS